MASMSTPARRVVSFIAGAMAMSASLAAVGAVVWSDIAQASQQPTVAVELTDELTEVEPVKLTKVKYAVVEEEDVVVPMPKKKRLVDFGRFEGY